MDFRCCPRILCQAAFLETVLYSQKAFGEFSEYTYLLGHIPKSCRTRIRWTRLSVEARPGGCSRCPFGPFTPNEIMKHRSHSGPAVRGLAIGLLNLYSQTLPDICGPELLSKKLVLHLTDWFMPGIGC
jgi:hypothetical protein